MMGYLMLVTARAVWVQNLVKINQDEITSG